AKRAALLEALTRSTEHGLDPRDYHVALLRDHLDERAGNSSHDSIHFELLASDALARYAFHLHFGKVNPEALDPSWNFTRTLEGATPVAAVLQRVIDAEDMTAELDALAPQEPRYAQLKDALREYRAIAEAGGWPKVEATLIRPGARGPDVLRLRERLRAEG